MHTRKVGIAGSCYDLGAGPTNVSYPPPTKTPSAVTITLPAAAQPSAPIILPSFTTAIPEILITWPTSHAHHYLSMEYFQDPALVATDNSDKDSPMRDQSPSPVVKPSSSPVVFLEAHKQPPPPWQAWLELSRPNHPKQRSRFPSSKEESAPKCQHHDDRSYTPIMSPTPIALSTLPSPPSATSPNEDSPPMQILTSYLGRPATVHSDACAS